MTKAPLTLNILQETINAHVHLNQGSSNPSQGI